MLLSALNLLGAFCATTAALALVVFTFFVVLNGGPAVLVPAVAVFVLGAVGAAWLTARRARKVYSSPAAELRRWAVAALGACTLTLFASMAATAVAIRRPPQEKLAAAFHARRADFEALRDMVLEDRLDGVIRGGDEFAREHLRYEPPGRLGLAAERVARYRRLMSAIGTHRIDMHDHRGSVQFAVAGWGMANRGWRMGIVWTARPPEPLLATVDGFHGTGEPDPKDYGYARIADEWYVVVIIL